MVLGLQEPGLEGNWSISQSLIEIHWEKCCERTEEGTINWVKMIREGFSEVLYALGLKGPVESWTGTGGRKVFQPERRACETGLPTCWNDWNGADRREEWWDLQGRWGQVTMTLVCYVRELGLSFSGDPGNCEGVCVGFNSLTSPVWYSNLWFSDQIIWEAFHTIFLFFWRLCVCNHIEGSEMIR